jgi:hypothetical protein
MSRCPKIVSWGTTSKQASKTSAVTAPAAVSPDEIGASNNGLRAEAADVTLFTSFVGLVADATLSGSS